VKPPLTARQREIVDLAAGLASEFAERAPEHDRDASFPFKNYERMREAGYLGLTVPEELGGMGAGLYELLLAQERLATGDSSTALAVNMHVSPVGQLSSLWRSSRDPRLEEFLRDAAAGKVVYASMTAERGHSILMTSNTVAERVDGGFRVSGDKIFGTESSVCTQFTTMARYDDPELGSRVMFFRIPRYVEGMTVKQTWDTMGMRGTQSNDFTLDGVFVPDEHVLGEVDAGFGVAMRTLDLFRPSVGAFAVGMAQAALDAAIEHAATRESFGKPLREFQAVSQQLAEAAVRTAAARHLVYEAAAAYDSGERVTKASAMAKLYATETAQFVIDTAIQIHGATGLERGHLLEHLYRDVRATRIYEGTSEIQREIITRELYR
jgi:alkylation response protein AidB-like acyl-CoA dehydrogenase